MNNILIVSGNEKATDTLASMLRVDDSPIISTVSNGDEARRLLITKDFNIIVINCPLSDEYGSDLAIRVAEQSYSGVVMIVKNDLFDNVFSKVVDYGILVVPKPVNRMIFYQSLKLADASRKRAECLRNDNVKLQSKLEEIKLVDRAKCILIQYEQLSEMEAHRYIEKKAMDERVSRKEIANLIIKSYET